MAISSITFGFAGPRISRDLTFADNGDGTVTKTTNVTLPNGREVSREQTKKGEINPTLLSGGLNGLRGIRTYVPDTANTDESSKYTSERGKITRTILVERPIAKLPPVAEPPVEVPIEEVPAADKELLVSKPPVSESQDPAIQIPIDSSPVVELLKSRGKSSEALQKVYDKLSERFDSASRAYQAAVVPKLQDPISLPPVEEVA